MDLHDQVEPGDGLARLCSDSIFFYKMDKLVFPDLGGTVERERKGRIHPGRRVDLHVKIVDITVDSNVSLSVYLTVKGTVVALSRIKQKHVTVGDIVIDLHP